MMQKWVRMPTYWIKDPDHYPLKQMRWSGEKKADNIAALMLYIVIVQHASVEIDIQNIEIGVCSLTYEQMGEITGLSRPKISGGLKILIDLDLIEKISEGKARSVYKVKNFAKRGGWAKLPASPIYNKEKTMISIFHDFNLRKKTELNALKLYLLILTFRDNSLNYAKISYEKIHQYAGIPANEVRAGLSLLINIGLIQLGKGAREGIHHLNAHNIYKPNYIDPYRNSAVVEDELINDFL